METAQFIKRINRKARKESDVALRFALYNFLYKNGVPVCTISSIMGVCRGGVYNGIYLHRQKLELNDKVAVFAEEEIKQHKIVIKPVFVNVNEFFVRQRGNAMVIDDIIF